MVERRVQPDIEQVQDVKKSRRLEIFHESSQNHQKNLLRHQDSRDSQKESRPLGTHELGQQTQTTCYQGYQI